MKKNKTVWIAIVSTVSICAILFIYLLYGVVSHENSYRPVLSDAIVVLGHSIDAGDSTPDAWLEKRLETALKLYHEAYAATIIVSGGKGPGDAIPVADAMTAWFMENGVDAAHILIEDQSKNTGENFQFTKKIAEEHQINKIIIVTNDFHMYRSMRIAADYFDEISGCGAGVAFDFHKALAYLKEPLSILKYEWVHNFS